MSYTNSKLRLLPSIFKKIGLAIVIAMFSMAGLSKVISLSLDTEILRQLILSGIIIGCLMMALSKHDIEDERSLQIRLISWFFAITSTCMYVAISPLTDLIFSGQIKGNDSVSMFVFMFFQYFLVSFYFNRTT